MNPKCLHIWPRGSYMMIALPNQDCSWTVTLFMPFEMFEQLTTPDKLIKFFETNYPDSLPLIGKERLVKDYFATKPSGLVTIKVSYSIQRECLFHLPYFSLCQVLPISSRKSSHYGGCSPRNVSFLRTGNERRKFTCNSLSKNKPKW